MNKNTIILIAYTILLLGLGYYLFHSSNDYKTNIENIESKYQKKMDSLNTIIQYNNVYISNLQALNDSIDAKIDSIKNNNNNYELPNEISFDDVSPTDVARKFSELRTGQFSTK